MKNLVCIPYPLCLIRMEVFYTGEHGLRYRETAAE